MCCHKSDGIGKLILQAAKDGIIKLLTQTHNTKLCHHEMATGASS